MNSFREGPPPQDSQDEPPALVLLPAKPDAVKDALHILKVIAFSPRALADGDR